MIEPGTQAQLDQFEAGAKPMAAMLKGYYDALIEAGFTVDQAFALTVDFGRYTWDRQLKQDPGCM